MESERQFPKRKATDRGASPLWNRALERYREELEEADDREILGGPASLDDLVNYAKTIEPLVPSERTALTSLNRLKPILKFVDDFSAVIAVCFGADAKLTAFVWGSIRLIITLASSAGETLQNALDMLEELSLALPRFRQYEETLPIDKNFENALLDVYTEIICFYARSIYFFRSHPHLPLRRTAWKNFHGDFERTVKRLKRMLVAVEKEADFARMKVDDYKYGELLQLLKNLKDNKITDDSAVQCYHIPLSSSTSSRFYGRQDDLQAVRQALDPGESVDILRSYAVYCMGGVGKTQLALHYAQASKKTFDTILWIAAENTMSMEQSFKDVAQALGLIQTKNDPADALGATLRVNNWLADSRRRWLLVFDNADNINILRHVWPGDTRGSVLVTSRDFNSAHSLTSAGLNLQPFDDSVGADVLLQLTGHEKLAPADITEAESISHALGGLPLALDQIAGFITQRCLLLQDFLPLYERNAAKIDSRKIGLNDYSHTLSTVWEMTLANLTGPEFHLQTLLAFFEPDAVHESILVEGSKLVDADEFEFLSDEMDLGDAEQVLLQTALINRNMKDKTISVHRLVQTAVLRRLNDADRQKYFGAAVSMLNWGFPDTWSKDIGHQKQAWKRCEICLPHVNSLIKVVSKFKIRAPKPDAWAELLLRYLYEREQYDFAKEFTATALSNLTDTQSLAYASATDLSGLVDLDMNKPAEAITSFYIALQVRQKILGPNDPFIAFSLNNLAIAYTELPDLLKAKSLHEKAIALRLENNGDRIDNSYSNLSALLLRMNEPDKAEETLMKCPPLQDCTDETFLATENPRYVGDMVLLSRIRRAQGRNDDALRLASKALAWRQKVHGDRFKTCDSLYDVASLLHLQTRSASAIELLGQLAAIAESLPGAEGQLARACYKLSIIYMDMQREDESQRFRQRALEVRAKLRPQDQHEPAFEESQFSMLNLFMLW